MLTPLSLIGRMTAHMTKGKMMASKLLADTFLFNPPMLVLYFAGTGVLEGKSPPDIKKKVQDSWLSAYTACIMFWPFVQFLNFKFVPIAMQANAVNAVGIGWQSYLSYSNHVREFKYDRVIPHAVIIGLPNTMKPAQYNVIVPPHIH